MNIISKIHDISTLVATTIGYLVLIFVTIAIINDFLDSLLGYGYIKGKIYNIKRRFKKERCETCGRKKFKKGRK